MTNPVDDDFDTSELTADEIVERLMDAELVEHVGRRVGEPERDGSDRAAGMTESQSSWTLDPVRAYELYVTTWDASAAEAAHRDVTIDHFHSDFTDWDRVMFVIAGRGWSVAGLAGPPDGEIPVDLLHSVRSELGGDVILDRGIPRSRAPRRRFPTAQHLIAELRRSGLVVDVLNDSERAQVLEGKSVTEEWYDDGNYEAIRLHRTGWNPQSALAEILLDDRSAESMVTWAPSMLEMRDDSPWATCVGECWSITISDDSDTPYPPALWAAELRGALDGQFVDSSPATDRELCDPIVVEAFSAFGRLPRLPRDTIIALSDSFSRGGAINPRDLIGRAGIIVTGESRSRIGEYAREASYFWRDAYYRRRGIDIRNESQRQRERELTGASRRICWAALSLSLLSILELEGVEPLPTDIDLRERMLADVADYEQVGGRLTRSRRFRQDLADESADRFENIRTHAELRELLGHGHPIPVGRGDTQRYVRDQFPGWDWNSLTGLLKEMGAIRADASGSAGAGRLADLEVAYFSDHHRWAVDWSDGSTTRSTT